jgi:hypothetical protein
MELISVGPMDEDLRAEYERARFDLFQRLADWLHKRRFSTAKILSQIRKIESQ